MTRTLARLLLGSGLTLCLGFSAGALAQEGEGSAERETLSETEDALERLLQDALNEGYVTLRGDETQEEPAPESASEGPALLLPAGNAPQEAPAHDAAHVPAYRDIGSILESTGYSPDEPLGRQDDAMASAQKSCQDTDLFTFRERSYSWQEISRLQSSVAGNAAAPGVEEQIRLAKHYLALGFAEEAMALVRAYPGSDRARTVLYMGEAVLGKISDVNALKLPESVCSREAGLWRAVSLIEAQPSTSLFLAGSALDELAGLPPQLRMDFGSRLGILAAENNQWALASSLYEVAVTDQEMETTPVIYLRALISAQNETERDVAINTIERIAQEDGPLQVKAILMLSNLAPEKEGEYYPGFYRDLENVVVRNSGVPQSFPQAFMEVRLATETGNYLRAVNLAADYNYPTRADQETMRDTLAGLFETGLSRNSVSTRFAALNGYLAQQRFFVGAEREQALTMTAARAALDLGLPDRAAALVETLPADTRPPEATRLLAGAYLEDGRYDAAIAATTGSDDDRMQMIAAAAYARSGRENAALAVLERAPGTWSNLEQQARIAWRSGNWAKARDAYAALLVAGQDRRLESYHALASYMSGQQGTFIDLTRPQSVEALEEMLSTHDEEMRVLREVLSHG